MPPSDVQLSWSMATPLKSSHSIPLWPPSRVSLIQTDIYRWGYIPPILKKDEVSTSSTHIASLTYLNPYGSWSWNNRFWSALHSGRNETENWTSISLSVIHRFKCVGSFLGVSLAENCFLRRRGVAHGKLRHQSEAQRWFPLVLIWRMSSNSFQEFPATRKSLETAFERFHNIRRSVTRAYVNNRYLLMTVPSACYN